MEGLATHPKIEKTYSLRLLPFPGYSGAYAFEALNAQHIRAGGGAADVRRGGRRRCRPQHDPRVLSLSLSVFLFIYIYIYMYIYTYVHVYIHTYIYKNV